MPKASIEKALKDAKGEKGDLDIEIVWEVRGPGRAAVLIEILCKNRSMIQVWHFEFMMCRIQPKQITIKMLTQAVAEFHQPNPEKVWQQL